MRPWLSLGMALSCTLALLGCQAELWQALAQAALATGDAPRPGRPSLAPPATPSGAARPTLAPEGEAGQGLPQVALRPEASPGASPLRHAEDLPDDEEGAYQVRVVYAVPKGGRDLARDTDGSLERSVEAAAAWFLQATGGRQALRFDRHQGQLDVGHVALEASEAELKAHGLTQRDALETQLKAQGLLHPKKLYAVYFEGGHARSCADAPHPPALAGNVVALYLQAVSGGIRCVDNGLSPDGQQAGYLEHSLVHEIVHALGFVPGCAAHAISGSGHTSFSPQDLMYAGSQAWRPTQLDGAGEFYRHGRSGCLDLARSAFLSPPEGPGEAPPRWSEGLARRYP